MKKLFIPTLALLAMFLAGTWAIAQPILLHEADSVGIVLEDSVAIEKGAFVLATTYELTIEQSSAAAMGPQPSYDPVVVVASTGREHQEVRRFGVWSKQCIPLRL